MKERHVLAQPASAVARRSDFAEVLGVVSGRAVIGLLLIASLIAFELFNFDTTRYALQDLMGEVSFAGLRWATILAIAFCAIDFAGLVRFFTPDNRDHSTPTEVWYLMGAWMLGATMNALMTWWAISLTLLNHDLGNEVVGREQLLQVVPIFVAALVWLTRVLFIGAFSVAGGHIFGQLRVDDLERLAAKKRVAQPSSSQMRRSPPGPGYARVPPDYSPAASQQEIVVRRHPERPVPGRPSRQPHRRPTPVPQSTVHGPTPMRAQGYSQR